MSCLESVPAHEIVLEQEGAQAVFSHIPMFDVKWQSGSPSIKCDTHLKDAKLKGKPNESDGGVWVEFFKGTSTSSNHGATTENQHTCELCPSCALVHTLSPGEMFHFGKQLEMFLTNYIKINRLPAEGSASCSGGVGEGSSVLCSCSSHLCTILADNRLP